MAGTILAAASALTSFPRAGSAASLASMNSMAGGLTVSVAYAEHIPRSPAPAAAFPVPWAGAPNTTFLGNTNPQSAECGAYSMCYDSAGVRFDNGGTAAVTVSRVSVDVHSKAPGGKIYDNLWGSFTVAPGKSVIIAENPPANNPSFDNFDTSDTPHGGCNPASLAPTVTLTVGGVATTLVDSTHVIDTGGIDSGGCKPARNESVQWRRIGATGGMNATLTLSPATASAFAGQRVTETATLLDGSGFGLPNATVGFAVISGPAAGLSGRAITDANGQAPFGYTSGGQGEDLVVATVTTVAAFQSNRSRVMWTGDSASGWSGADVGAASPPGAQSFDAVSGRWSVSGGGADISGTADQFHLLSQQGAPTTGISGRVISQQDTDPLAKAGLMVRSTASAGAPYYAALLTPGHGIVIQTRSAQGGATTTIATSSGGVPAWLWVSVSGATYTTYTSTDGYFWQPLAGSSTSLSLGSAPLVGIAVSSHSNGQSSVVSIDSVAVGPSAPPPQPPIVCPGPWTCTDIGSPAVAGSAVVNGGTWTIQGGGGDIHGTADQFQFDWRSLGGAGGISAHVLSQGNTSVWAKAGVMLRAGLDPGAANYALLVTPANGIVVQYRSAQGGTTVRSATVAGVAPAYVRVSRAAATFSASTSADGVTWTPVPGSTVSLAALSGVVLEGMAVTSHNSAAASTVTMDSILPS